jgi:hypothetical protein
MEEISTACHTTGRVQEEGMIELPFFFLPSLRFVLRPAVVFSFGISTSYLKQKCTREDVR